MLSSAAMARKVYLPNTRDAFAPGDTRDRQLIQAILASAPREGAHEEELNHHDLVQSSRHGGPARDANVAARG
jgi:hypothetical protein